MKRVKLHMIGIIAFTAKQPPTCRVDSIGRERAAAANYPLAEAQVVNLRMMRDKQKEVAMAAGDNAGGIRKAAPDRWECLPSRFVARCDHKPQADIYRMSQPLGLLGGLCRQLAHQLYETDRGDPFALWPRFCTTVNEIALFYLERLSCGTKAA
jgi:hypothetical protein